MLVAIYSSLAVADLYCGARKTRLIFEGCVFSILPELWWMLRCSHDFTILVSVTKSIVNLIEDTYPFCFITVNCIDRANLISRMRTFRNENEI